MQDKEKGRDANPRGGSDMANYRNMHITHMAGDLLK